MIEDGKWTESLAVRGQQFTENYLDAVGIKANGKQAKIIGNCYVIREEGASYNASL